ncbi:MAG: hypothetical protein FJX62_11180 [Alphaproteobacteria bacterium]|nr:hypothetical protein [Alphaproteobacteria bacterium]
MEHGPRGSGKLVRLGVAGAIMLRVAIALTAMLSAALLFHVGPVVAQSGPNCPAEFVENRAEAAKLKAELKAQLARRGVPPRIQRLVDGLPNCRGCIGNDAGTRVGLVIEYPEAEFRKIYGSGGTSLVSNHTTGDGRVIVSLEWTPDDEQRARRQLRRGSTRAFHIVIGQFPCRCCPGTADGVRAWQNLGGAHSTKQPGYVPLCAPRLTPGMRSRFATPTLWVRTRAI